MTAQVADLRLRGALLRPAGEDQFDFSPDGAVITDAAGIVTYLGPFAGRPAALPESAFQPVGLLIPPLLDCHIHIPQHPIRGRFVEGIAADAPGGQLLAGLARNVYPAEQRCADPIYARDCVQRFAEETRRNGTLGGVAYMTAHPQATRIALDLLPPSWRVGLVLMDMNCVPGLCISVADATAAMERLARDFGQRFVVTDRFAVACSTPLRRAGVAVAKAHDLEMQTHLSEQLGELETIKRLYPDARNYTDVYDRDGLLERGAILAHCIHLSHDEWPVLTRQKSRIAHCPVSNTLLGSGVMPLDQVYRFGLDWALCTDVGASPTTSLLAELTHFLRVHTSSHATPQTGLWRCTAGAQRVGKIQLGGLTHGQRFSAVEFAPPRSDTTDDAIRDLLGPPGETMTQMEQKVAQVRNVWGT